MKHSSLGSALYLLAGLTFLALPLKAMAAVICLAALWAGISFLLKTDPRLAAYGILGAAAATLPILGDAALPLALLTLALDCRSSERSDWASPLLICVFANLLILFCLELDPQAMRFAFLRGYDFADGLLRMHKAISLSPPIWLFEGRQALRLLVLVMLAVRLAGSREKSAAIAAGLSLGCFLNSFALLAETGRMFSRFSAQSIFFAERRAAGLFSDPNALGVAALLMVSPWSCFAETIKVGRHRLYFYLIGAALLTLAFVSGSKTLAVGLFTAALSWSMMKRGRSSVILFGAILSALIIAAGGGSLLEYLPPGASRALAPLFLGQPLFGSLGSKLTFLHVDLAVFRDSPLSGVGLGAFSRMFPIYSERLGYNIGSLSDNPNSFFLGILVEFGIVGGVALLLSLAALRIRPGSRALDNSVLIGAGLSLFFGSHLAATEVCILFGFLLGQTMVFADGPRVSVKVGLFAVCLLLSIPRAASSEYGVFPFEGGMGQRSRWMGRRAAVIVPCSESGEARIIISAPGEALPTNVRVSARGSGRIVDIRLESINERVIDLPCGEHYESGAKTFAEGLLLHIETSKVFSPMVRRRTGDGRILGLKLIQ